MELTALKDLFGRYDVPCEILDLRPLRCAGLKDYGKKHRMVTLPGDPAGTTIVNLGEKSKLYGVNPFLFRGVFNERWETIRNHLGKTQRYGLSSSIVNADVYISLPKLKTHHKVGTTLNLKGLVGANTIKNYLVHWRVGWPSIGGDEYPNFRSWFDSKFQKVVNRGAWNGNDTIWRKVVDLHNALISTGKRRTFSVIDGVLGGQGNGPFCPQSIRSNVLIAGESLLETDLVASRLMGFNVNQIPYLSHFIDEELVSLEQIKVVSEQYERDNFFTNDDPYLDFLPPTAWSNLVNF